MGQYYVTAVKTDDGKTTIYNRYLLENGKKQYTMAKLMEHSWVGNHYMESICALFDKHKKLRIAWVGDYSIDLMDADWNNEELPLEEASALYDLCWRTEGYPIEYAPCELTGKYFVNHTKKQYFSFDNYYKKSVMFLWDEYWCIHPLSLLTCIGNRLGGGDYLQPTEDSTYDLVGSWAWDELSIVEAIPKEYEEISPIFKEK